MPGLDEADRRILSLLCEDARRTYRDVADRVGLSPPAISDPKEGYHRRGRRTDHAFCCASCEARFRERHRELAEEA
jgi:hypothetical protein